MIELTVQIEERDGEVWCTMGKCEWKFATDKERQVLGEDFFPLMDNTEHSMSALKGLNANDDDESQLELDLDLDDDPFDDEEFDEYLDDWDDGGLVLDNAPEDDSFF